MWNWAIWGALILVSLAGIVALVLPAIRSRQAWRDVKDFRREVVDRLDAFARNAETTAERVASAGDTAGLQESVGHLRVSLAQLAVLTEALDEAQISFDRVIAVVPRK